MHAALSALLAVACAPPPAERLRDPHQIPHVEPVAVPRLPKPQPDVVKPKSIAFPRPDIPVDVRAAALRDAMDVHDHLRWPLTANRHPALEPAYPIAPVFAAPGVGWTDLCKVGAQNRRTSGVPLDQIEYLRAWCEVAKHEPESAVVRLAPLLKSTVVTLPASVRRDITNIVVDSGDSEYAQRVLASAHVDEVAMFDLISASYEEIGKTSDAMVFNDLAIDAYTMTRPGDHCHRLAKRVVIAEGDNDERKVRLEILERAAPKDETCRKLHNELTCWAGRTCVPYMADHGINEQQASVVDAYMRWPSGGATPSSWMTYAASLTDLAGTPGADVLGTAALEASLLSLGCVGARIHEVRAGAHDIQINAHDKTLDARLDVIIDEPKKICEKKP